MKRLINIQNNIHRVIYYLSITILMCGGIICLFPPTDAIAETKQECQREIRGISGKLGAKPSPEAYSKALRYCMAGDMRSATSVLQTDSGTGRRKQASKEVCEREIRGISGKLGAKPSPEAYSKALRYCMAGDMRSATSVLQTDSGSGSNKQVSKKDCKLELLRLSHRLGVMPGKKSYNKALGSCQEGDMRGAYSVLKADSGSGSNKQVSKSWCKEELRVFGMRLGAKTSNKSFSKAQRYCQQGDLEKAHKVITADR